MIEVSIPAPAPSAEPEVFRADSEAELIDQLVKSKENATSKIRELNREVELLTQLVVEGVLDRLQRMDRPTLVPNSQDDLNDLLGRIAAIVKQNESAVESSP